MTHLDNNQEVYSVFFDTRKAFDSVSHELLLTNLARIQVNPYNNSVGKMLLDWKVSDAWWLLVEESHLFYQYYQVFPRILSYPVYNIYQWCHHTDFTWQYPITINFADDMILFLPL